MQETIKGLQEVYAYNEKVVPDVDKYLDEIGVGHLKYHEKEGKFREVGLPFFNNRDKINLYGKDLDEIESHIINLSKVSTDITELKGISVSKGKIKGTVQLIKDPNNLHQAKEGAILVTGMTRPQFNERIIKCKGIITDEGNILSHASIITREYGIPSLVGTKNATKVFKDGDIVELDATNAIARLIKRN